MNIANITIREATKSDLDSICQLATKFATSYIVQRSAFKESFTKVLIDDSAIVFVASIDEKIIGYCLGFTHPAFYANGYVAWLEEIFVEEDFRKKDVGRILINRFEEWAKLKQCSLNALATRRAAGFYKAIGYEESAIYFKKAFK